MRIVIYKVTENYFDSIPFAVSLICTQRHCEGHAERKETVYTFSVIRIESFYLTA